MWILAFNTGEAPEDESAFAAMRTVRTNQPDPPVSQKFETFSDATDAATKLKRHNDYHHHRPILTCILGIDHPAVVASPTMDYIRIKADAIKASEWED